MNRQTRLKRLAYRSWHRGTKEADLMVGGFYDRYSAGWNDDEIGWFERLMDEQDVDIVAWAIGSAVAPPHIAGPMINAMQRLDYVAIQR